MFNYMFHVVRVVLKHSQISTKKMFEIILNLQFDTVLLRYKIFLVPTVGVQIQHLTFVKN